MCSDFFYIYVVYIVFVVNKNDMRKTNPIYVINCI